MNRYASVSVLLAGILWGTMGLFVRRLNAWGLASMSIVELRSLFTAILLFTGLAIGNRRALRILRANPSAKAKKDFSEAMESLRKLSGGRRER